MYTNDTTRPSRNTSTIPAPSSDLLDRGPEVAAYLAASERVRSALAEQATCLRALRALEVML